MSDIFKALADPTRRSIMLMLCQESNSVNNISEHFNMSRPAISKHIKILQEAELVKIEPDKKDGRQRNCYAQLEAMQEIHNYLSKLENFWKQNLSDLGNFLDEEAAKSNEV